MFAAAPADGATASPDLKGPAGADAAAAAAAHARRRGPFAESTVRAVDRASGRDTWRIESEDGGRSERKKKNKRARAIATAAESSLCDRAWWEQQMLAKSSALLGTIASLRSGIVAIPGSLRPEAAQEATDAALYAAKSSAVGGGGGGGSGQGHDSYGSSMGEETQGDRTPQPRLSDGAASLERGGANRSTQQRWQDKSTDYSKSKRQQQQQQQARAARTDPYKKYSGESASFQSAIAAELVSTSLVIRSFLESV
jgi:hypothetical protein